MTLLAVVLAAMIADMVAGGGGADSETVLNVPGFSLTLNAELSSCQTLLQKGTVSQIHHIMPLVPTKITYVGRRII
jgi:hypothetical protein